MQFGWIEEKCAFFFSASETLITYRGSKESILVSFLEELGIHTTIPSAKIAFLTTEMLVPYKGYTIKSEEEKNKFWVEFSSTLIRNCGIEDKDGNIAAYVASKFRSPDIWVAYPDAQPALEALRKRGCLLGVIANGEQYIKEALVKLSLADYLDIITISKEVGVEKPDPRIFQWTIEKFDLKPEQCVYVGDVPEIDLIGARNAGITPVWIDRNRLARKIGEINKVEVLTDVEFLFPIVPYKKSG
ncbi:MAG: HAD-IIIA family hydrolase [Methanomassiliicoccales archaeon]|jgi:putative hydrolase of the HAD superfamily|nr:HAD-IIIA family hydrolase [Methanomassiliicoccales archaeon]